MHALAVPEDHLPIYRLEAELLKLPQVEMPTEHDHCDGVYARTMHLVAGHAYTGAVHRHECFFVVRSGSLVATSDDGPRQLVAGDMLVTRAGSKRAVVALTDCVVTTFHANPINERSPAALWDLLVTPAPALELEGA